MEQDKVYRYKIEILMDSLKGLEGSLKLARLIGDWK